jgi:hypothetical protein
MAEQASLPDSEAASANCRSIRTIAQPLRAGDGSTIAPNRERNAPGAAPGFTETLADRYAFSLFMGIVGLGILVMVILALTM